MPFDVVARVLRPLRRGTVTLVDASASEASPPALRELPQVDPAGLDLRRDIGPTSDAAVERLRSVIARHFGRSLHVRHLDAGSCNGCDWEIAALLNPYYDIQRLGIDFVASPRHADLLLVTGIMTRNLEEAARRTYDAMPEPRLVVAVGACAINGGVFSGTYAGRDGIAEVLPVDADIPGCPPRPGAIIDGILLALTSPRQLRPTSAIDRDQRGGRSTAN